MEIAYVVEAWGSDGVKRDSGEGHVGCRKGNRGEGDKHETGKYETRREADGKRARLAGATPCNTQSEGISKTL